MKKTGVDGFVVVFILISLMVCPETVWTQEPVLYSISSQDDTLRVIDPANGTIEQRIVITLPGSTVLGGTGLATRPLTGELWALLKLEGPGTESSLFGRELVTIDPATGEATSIGNTGDRFAGLAFDNNGTLYGITGDGANISETLFILSTVDATPTFLLELGRGDDGETIGFNPDNGLLYHASGHYGDIDDVGEEGVIFESIDLNTLTVTDIPIAGTDLVEEEAQALTYWPAKGIFLWKQDHGPGPLYRVTLDGVPTLIVANLDHQAKGLAFSPDFRLPGDVSNNRTVTAFDAGLILQAVVGLIAVPTPEYPAFTLLIADVTKNGSISPLDAAHILLFTVGLPSALDPLSKPPVSGSGMRQVALDIEPTSRGMVASLTIDTRDHILAGEFTLILTDDLRPIQVTPAAGADFITAHRLDGDQLRVAFAGTKALSGSGRLIQIVFEGHPTDPEAALALQKICLNEGRIPATIESNRNRAMPLQYTLEQNTPNPFNPTTAIRYSLPEAGQVRLAIYNLLGQQVQVLVDTFQPAGSHHIVWDGRDSHGRLVGSGVYLYRLTAGEFSQTRRMLLLK